MIMIMLRRTKGAILLHAVLLFALFGIALAQLTLAQAPESSHDGPVISILQPAEGQRVAGPEFEVEIEVRPGSGGDVNRDSLSIIVGSAGDLKDQFTWEGNRATATLTESPALPLGQYTLVVGVADVNGDTSSAQRTFQFAIPEELARLLGQRLEVPWQEFVTFKDAHDKFLVMQHLSYRDPTTGVPLTKQNLLNGLGRSDWLSPTSPFSDRVTELALVTRHLVWKEYGSAEDGPQTEIISTVSGNPNADTPEESLRLMQNYLELAYEQIGAAQPSQWLSCADYTITRCLRTLSGWRYDPIRYEAHYYVTNGIARFRPPEFQPSGVVDVVEARLLLVRQYPDSRSPTMYLGHRVFKLIRVEVRADVGDDLPDPSKELPHLHDFYYFQSLADDAPPSISVDPKWIVPNPENVPAQFNPQSIFVQLTHTPAPPVCDTFATCYGQDKSVDKFHPSYYAAVPLLIYRPDFPPIHIPMVDEYYCGVDPNPKTDPQSLFDIDGDGIINEQESAGWHNALTAKTGTPIKTDLHNCDSTGNALKDGEARKWNERLDRIEPLFSKPNERIFRSTGVVTTSIDFLDGPYKETRSVEVPDQRWQAVSGAEAGDRRGFGGFWIDGTLYAPPLPSDHFSYMQHGSLRRLRDVNVGQVRVALHSHDLKFQTINAPGPHFLGTLYLAVEPALFPDLGPAERNATLRRMPRGGLSVWTTGDFEVELQFLSADQANGFIVAPDDQPGRSPQIRDIPPGELNFNTHVELTETRLKQWAVKTPFLGLGIKRTTDGREIEFTSKVLDLRFAPANTTVLGESPREHAPLGVSGGTLTQTLKLLGPGANPPSPRLISLDPQIEWFGSPSLVVSKWNAPFPVWVSNDGTNPRDVLRIRLRGTVRWDMYQYPVIPTSQLTRRPPLVHLRATNDFDLTYYIMLRRGDWHCAMCEDVQVQGAVTPNIPPYQPGTYLEGSPQPAMSTSAIPAEEPGTPLIDEPTMLFDDVAVGSTIGLGSTVPDTIRVTWDPRTVEDTPQMAFVILEAFHLDDEGAPSISALAGPFTVTTDPSPQAIDLPAPTPGTYEVGVSLLDASLDLHDSYFDAVEIPAAAPVHPTVQLDAAASTSSGQTGAITWTASNPAGDTASVTALAALLDARGNLLEVAVGDPTIVGPGGSATGALTFAPAPTAGHYVAEFILRDDMHRIVGQRRVPLALGVPASQLSGVYSDTPVGTAPYEGITVTVGIDAGAADRYQVYGDLLTADGRLIVHRQHAGANLDAGPGSVSLFFDGLAIGWAGGEGPFELRNVELRDGIGNLLDVALQPYTTTTGYPAGSFPSPGIQLSGSLDDRGALATEDGRFGALAVDVGITVTVPSTYVVEAGLTHADGGYIDRAHTIVSVGAGDSSVRLLFPGELIAAAGHDGPYTIRELRILHEDGTIRDSSTITHATHAYSVDQFAGRSAGLTGSFDHRLVAGPGGSNRLVLDVEVEVARTGTYQLEVLLSGETGRWVPWTTAVAFLEPGVQQISVPLDLAAARHAAVDGRLNLDVVRLIGPGSLLPILDDRRDVYTLTELSLWRSDLYLPAIETSGR